jgi:integrase
VRALQGRLRAVPAPAPGCGQGLPRQPRYVGTDGHIPRDWFRGHVWKPALKAAKLDVEVQAKHMRHVHSSWLPHGGADLQVAKERMGHAKISCSMYPGRT